MQTIPLTQAGSNRVYTRIIADDGSTHIHCEGTNRVENHAFITMSRHFERLNLPTPRLLSVSDDEMSYDQQDLGDTSLYDYICREKKVQAPAYSDKEGLSLSQDSSLYVLLTKTMHALHDFHDLAAQDFDFSVCFPVPSMDRRSIFWDLNYFKYCFLKIATSTTSHSCDTPLSTSTVPQDSHMPHATSIVSQDRVFSLPITEIDEVALENDFETLANAILAVPQDTLIIRDCQSRNVMIYNDSPYFIDYQGGRLGSRYYDIVSFLWQARANFSPSLREQLLQEYGNLDRSTVDHFILFRTLQVLGAYGFRGLIEHKEAFLGQIPTALNTLHNLLSNNPHFQQKYPYFSHLFIQQ